MKVLNCILCEDIIRDVETDRVTIINTIEEINAIGFPLFLQKLCCFVSLDKEGIDIQSFDGKLIIKNNDKTLVDMSAKIVFLEKPRARVMIKLAGIPIYEPGILVVEMLESEKIFLNYNIPINQPKQAGQAFVSAEPKE